MYASTLPELAGQKFNDIAEAVITIDWQFRYNRWYDELMPFKRAHVCLEWIVAV